MSAVYDLARHDTNVDSLISKMYPNLEEYEEHEERLIEDLNKNRNVNNAFTQSCRQGILNQLGRRKRTAAAPEYGKRKRAVDVKSLPMCKRQSQSSAADVSVFAIMNDELSMAHTSDITHGPICVPSARILFSSPTWFI